MLRPKGLAVALLLLYFAAAVRMAFALPAHATPNELLNYEYVQVMRQIGGLPNRGLVDSEVRYTEWHQPPLYFTFAALFGLSVPVPPSAANPPPPIEVQANPHYLSTPRGNLNPVVHVGPAGAPLLYTSRVAAALLGMLGVAALYAAGKRVYSPAAGLLMASILAFQPTFLHLSGSVNNDMPLAAVAAGVMAFAVMLLAANPLANFIEKNPTIVMLALAFLLMIGTTLIAEGMGLHVPKGYIYAAMAFSALVEVLNMFSRNARQKAKGSVKH